jgi:hypothetical protein
MNRSAYVFLSCLFLFSCREKEPEATPQPRGGTLTLALEFEVDGVAAEYGTLKYTNEAGNLFSIDLAQFYISNFRVRNTEGSWKDIKLYRLVRHNNEASRIIKLELPFAAYDSISFYAGVDSLTNHTMGNTGDLDPSLGLFWPWEGYLFYMFEGKYQRGANQMPFAYHIGGDDYLMKYRLALPSGTILEEKNGEAGLTLGVNLAEIFKSPHQVNLDSVALVSHTTDEPALTNQMKENLLDAIKFKQ